MMLIIEEQRQNKEKQPVNGTFRALRAPQRIEYLLSPWFAK